MTALNSVLDGLTTAISADAAAAAVSFDAHATLVGVTEVDVATGAHTFKVDEPAVLGGTDLAANPVQLVLASLGACQAITYQVWAAKLGIALEGVEARVEGDIDLRGFLGLLDGVRPGYTRIRCFVTLKGPEPDARYEELVAAVNAHCPVLDIVANPVPVEREVKFA
jgi:putative redox protein